MTPFIGSTKGFAIFFEAWPLLRQPNPGKHPETLSCFAHLFHLLSSLFHLAKMGRIGRLDTNISPVHHREHGGKGPLNNQPHIHLI